MKPAANLAKDRKESCFRDPGPLFESGLYWTQPLQRYDQQALATPPHTGQALQAEGVDRQTGPPQTLERLDPYRRVVGHLVESSRRVLGHHHRRSHSSSRPRATQVCSRLMVAYCCPQGISHSLPTTCHHHSGSLLRVRRCFVPGTEDTGEVEDRCYPAQVWRPALGAGTA